ncbi:hypothetical protein RSAG8_07319, partial [Rhizoctonia solani AG-8 WAC10335]
MITPTTTRLSTGGNSHEDASDKTTEPLPSPSQILPRPLCSKLALQVALGWACHPTCAPIRRLPPCLPCPTCALSIAHALGHVPCDGHVPFPTAHPIGCDCHLSHHIGH